MKKLIKFFFFVSIFCLTIIGVFAQKTIYFDANYNRATSANYTYKRIIKYNRQIIITNVGVGYYGEITANAQATNLHVCSIVDYFRNGQPALVVNAISTKLDCSNLKLDGKAIHYYRNGKIKLSELYYAGKLHGKRVFYNRDGTERKREDYEKGRLIDNSKFAVSSNHPLVGTWKHIEYYGKGNEAAYKKLGVSPTVKRKSTYIYNQNGVVDVVHKLSYTTQRAKLNWKYTSKDSYNGILEEYQGKSLIERGTIRWLNRNKLEYTVTFSTNPNGIGNRSIWTRQ